MKLLLKRIQPCICIDYQTIGIGHVCFMNCHISGSHLGYDDDDDDVCQVLFFQIPKNNNHLNCSNGISCRTAVELFKLGRMMPVISLVEFPVFFIAPTNMRKNRR